METATKKTMMFLMTMMSSALKRTATAKKWTVCAEHTSPRRAQFAKANSVHNSPWWCGRVAIPCAPSATLESWHRDAGRQSVPSAVLLAW